MMNQIVSDLFKGWRTARLRRMRYFCYSLLIMSVEFTVFAAIVLMLRAAEAKEVSVSTLIISSLLLLCTLLLCIYCSVLTLTKRIRDLGIGYSIVVAIIITVVDVKFWPLFDSLQRADNVDVWVLLRVVAVTLIVLINIYILFGKSR
ncbi:TPA: hypothetical protein ACIJRN_000976 [Klebsiella aerogenes]